MISLANVNSAVSTELKKCELYVYKIIFIGEQTLIQLAVAPEVVHSEGHPRQARCLNLQLETRTR